MTQDPSKHRSRKSVRAMTPSEPVDDGDTSTASRAEAFTPAVPLAAGPSARAFPESDLPVALPSRALFWRPRHSAPSRSLRHVPFLFWLMETQQPALAVQIGLDDASGFLSLCQAADKLPTETYCIGIAPDPGQPPLPDEMARLHARLYGDFSFVVAETIGNAARQVRDADIDLLIIDMPMNDEAVTALRAHWLPRLSERAIMLVHAPERNLQDKSGRDFLDELLRGTDGISFSQSTPGLEVVLLGHNQPERIRLLAHLEFGKPGFLAARAVFTRLGQGLESEAALLAASAQFGGAQSEADNAGERLAQLEKELETERRLREEAEKSEAAQLAEAASLRARIFDLEVAQTEAANQKLADAEAETASLRVRIFDLEASLADISAKEAAERKLVAREISYGQDLDRKLTAARAELDTATQGLQAATTTVGELRAQLTGAGQKQEEQCKQIEALQKEKDALAAAKVTEAKEKSELAAMLASTRAELDTATQGLQAATMTVGELRAQLTDAGQKQEEQCKQIEALLKEKDVLDAAARRQVELEARLGRAEAAVAEHETALTAAEADLRSATDELLERDRALAGFAERLEAAQRSNATLSAELEGRARDVLELTRIAEGLHETLAQMEQEAASQQGAIALDRKQIQDLAQENVALRESTSWKITAPLRRAKLGILGTR